VGGAVQAISSRIRSEFTKKKIKPAREKPDNSPVARFLKARTESYVKKQWLGIDKKSDHRKKRKKKGSAERGVKRR